MSDFHDIISNQDGYVKKAIMNNATGDFAVVASQDIEPILQSIQDLKDNSGGFSEDREMQIVARIPLLFYNKWKAEGYDFFLMDDCPEASKLLEKLIARDCPALKIAKGSI